jgi:hypothetical protein
MERNLAMKTLPARGFLLVEMLLALGLLLTGALLLLQALATPPGPLPGRPAQRAGAARAAAAAELLRAPEAGMLRAVLRDQGAVSLPVRAGAHAGQHPAWPDPQAVMLPGRDATPAAWLPPGWRIAHIRQLDAGGRTVGERALPLAPEQP